MGQFQGAIFTDYNWSDFLIYHACWHDDCKAGGIRCRRQFDQLYGFKSKLAVKTFLFAVYFILLTTNAAFI